MAASPNTPSPPNPLVVSYPPPQLLFQYPLTVTNVRLLCDKSSKTRGQASLTTTIQTILKTYKVEGILGLFHGAHWYMLHQAVRDTCRYVADVCISKITGPYAPKSLTDDEQRSADFVKPWGLRLCAKYFIDFICYPILLASTRSIVLRNDPRRMIDLVKEWHVEEGVSSLWNGVTAQLLSTAIEEALELIISRQIDKASAGLEIEPSDTLLIKLSSTSVTSVFTAQINYVGVIQRCTSALPGMIASGMLAPSPIDETVKSLPWRSSVYQLFLYGGILALNVRLIQWKLELQAEDNERNNRN